MASSPRASKPIGEEAEMASCWTVRRQRSRQQVADDGETTEQRTASTYGSSGYLGQEYRIRSVLLRKRKQYGGYLLAIYRWAHTRQYS
jgi:hypothetical protein